MGGELGPFGLRCNRKKTVVHGAPSKNALASSEKGARGGEEIPWLSHGVAARRFIDIDEATVLRLRGAKIETRSGAKMSASLPSTGRSR